MIARQKQHGMTPRPMFLTGMPHISIAQMSTLLVFVFPVLSKLMPYWQNLCLTGKIYALLAKLRPCWQTFEFTGNVASLTLRPIDSARQETSIPVISAFHDTNSSPIQWSATERDAVIPKISISLEHSVKLETKPASPLASPC